MSLKAAGAAPNHYEPFERPWSAGAVSAFSIRNTILFSSRSVISTLSPVSRIRFGMSMTDNGSVQCTSRKWPGSIDFSALRVFSAGNGHLRPVRLSLVVVMRSGLKQVGVAEKADAVAGLHLDDGFAEFHQPIGFDQGRQQASSFARKFGRLQHSVRRLTKRDADIFAAATFLFISEGGAHRHGYQWHRRCARKGQHRRAHHVDEGDE